MSDSPAPSNPDTESQTFRSSFPPIRWLHALYAWVVGWADKPGGTIALGTISFAEASFFPIPPDPLMWAMCIGDKRKSLWFATVTTLTSVAGGVLGWLIGMYLFSEVVVQIVELMGWQKAWFGSQGASQVIEGITMYEDGKFMSFRDIFEEYGFFALFVAALTPIPYKVATIASGVFGMGLVPVVLGSVLGRGLRFFAFALIFLFLGDQAKRFIDRYFTPLSILGALLGVGGFFLLKYL